MSTTCDESAGSAQSASTSASLAGSGAAAANSLPPHPATFNARGPTLSESRLNDLDAVISFYGLKPPEDPVAHAIAAGEAAMAAQPKPVGADATSTQNGQGVSELPAPTLKVYKCSNCLRAFLSEEAREEHLGNSLVCEQAAIPRSVRQRTHAKVFPDSVCNDDYEDEPLDPERAALYRIALQATSIANSHSAKDCSSDPAAQASTAESIVQAIAQRVRQVRAVLTGTVAAVRPSGQGGQKLTKRVKLLREMGGATGSTEGTLAGLVNDVSALGALNSDVAAALSGDISSLSADSALAVAALVDHLGDNDDKGRDGSGADSSASGSGDGYDDSMPARAWTGHLRENLGLGNSQAFELTAAAGVVAAAANAGPASDAAAAAAAAGKPLSALTLASLVSSNASSTMALSTGVLQGGVAGSAQGGNVATLLSSSEGLSVPVGGDDEDGDSKDPWISSANDVINFRFVGTESDLHSTKSTFKPTYTHQIFNNEQIYGYKGLSVDLYFTAGSLYPYFAYRYKDVKPPLSTEEDSKDVASTIARLTYRPPDDIIGALASKLPASCFSKSLEEFKQRIYEPFNPPGEMIHSYTVPTLIHQHKGHRLESSFHIFRGRLTDPAMREFHERLQFFLLFYIDRSSYIDSNDPVWEVLLVAERLFNKTTQETTWRTVGYTTLYTFLHYPKGSRLRLSQILILPPYQRQGHGQQLLNAVFAEADRRDVVEINIEDPAVGFQALRDLTDVTRCRDRGFFQKASRTQSFGYGARSLASPTAGIDSAKESMLSLSSSSRSFSGIVSSNSNRRDAAAAAAAAAAASYVAQNVESSSPSPTDAATPTAATASTRTDVVELDPELQQVIAQAQKQPHVWNRKYAEYVRRELRITLAQVRRCYEIFRFASIDPRDEEGLKEFRLDVKKRLFKDHEEELSIYVNDPEGRKKRLQELYQELEDAYRNVCRKARIR